MLVEEIRWGAVSPGYEASVLTLGGKSCSFFRAFTNIDMDILLPDALFANFFLLLYHSSIAFIRQQSRERGTIPSLTATKKLPTGLMRQGYGYRNRHHVRLRLLTSGRLMESPTFTQRMENHLTQEGNHEGDTCADQDGYQPYLYHSQCGKGLT